MRNVKMNLNEKLISEFMALGCQNRKEAVVALQVYMELCEVKKYWDVESKYHNDLKQIYFTAKKTKNDSDSVFIPKSTNENLSYNKMKSCFTLSDNSDERIFLVLVASDSTCVYYQISDGLFEPTDTSSRQLKINKQEKVDADIRKNRKLLEEAALCGIAITLKEAKS